MPEYKVMLVENDETLLQQMADVVQDTVGFQVAAAYSDVRDAINQGSVFRPTMILLDVDDIDDYSTITEFTEKFPDAKLLALGEKWTLPLFRSVIKAGAGGYLVVPFTSAELINGVRTFEEETQHSKVMTLFSPKGKSGRTTFIANLAMALANVSGSHVGIIDADLQFGDMALFFNITPQSTIIEAIRDIGFLSPTTLKSYFVPVSDKVSVLCGARRPEYAENVMPDDFTRLIQMARGAFPYLIIDIPAGFTPISIAACEASDKVGVMAMISGGFEMQHMSRALEIFQTWDDYEDKVKAILTRVAPYTDEMRRQLEGELGYPLYGIVPNDYLLLSTAANNGRIVADIRPNSPFAQSVAELAKGMYISDRRG